MGCADLLDGTGGTYGRSVVSLAGWDGMVSVLYRHFSNGICMGCVGFAFHSLVNVL